MKTILKIFGLFYFSTLFYIFFLARRRRGPALPWHSRPLNLIPFKEKILYFTSHHHFRIYQKWNFYTDFLGNILLFIPFAFFLTFAFHVRSQSKILLMVLLTSICVELIQFLFSIGVADIDDVILNTLGGIIGLAFVRMVNKHFLPRPLHNE